MFKINKDQRQYLNLSTYADAVLRNDIAVFSEDGNKSGFLNRVLRLYAKDADASVSARLAGRRKELEQTLYMVSGETKENIITALLEDYKKQLLSGIDYPKEVNIGWDFRLDDDNAAYIYGSEPPCPENAYYKRGSDYIKAVLEEYARKTGYEREAILFRDEIRFIEDAISEKKLLRINSGGMMFEVRGYGILPDPQHRYHYLTGYTRVFRSKDDETMASFRLSRIDHDKTRTLSPNNNHSGKITKVQKKALENAILNRGVMYLLRSKKTVYLRLTERGKKRYDRKLNLRPQIAVPDESSAYFGKPGVYVCSGTLLNIEDYFFDFGADAEILEPEELRDQFAKRYASASRLYEIT